MKITDNLIIALLKHGVVGSVKNFKTEIVLPNDDPSNTSASTTCIITAETLEIKLLKE